MLHKLLVLAIALATACTPVPTPPATVPSVLTAVATVSPVRTDTPAPTVFSATVDPTDAPPDRTFHPSRMSPVLGKADVMAIVCFSKTTTIAGYSYGLEWSYDTSGYEACVKAGKV